MAKNNFIQFVEKEGVYYGIHKKTIGDITAQKKIPLIIVSKDGLEYLKKHCIKML